MKCVIFDSIGFRNCSGEVSVVMSVLWFSCG